MAIFIESKRIHAIDAYKSLYVNGIAEEPRFRRKCGARNGARAQHNMALQAYMP
jgi:hypothetical protein